ncbi:MAG: hypothetical protein N2109_01705 [Fimbriimonadales bacterium]|nr:hypothetical protein [Fimbriimonadales bacterium]
MKTWRIAWQLAAIASVGCSQAPKVGETSDGGSIVPTLQVVRPAGDTLEIAGRPVDLEVIQEGKAVALDNRGLVLFDLSGWRVEQEVPLRKGTSQVGLAWDPESRTLFASTAGDEIAVARLREGRLQLEDPIPLGAAPVGGAPYPTGLAWSAQTGKLLACLSRANLLAEVDPSAGRVVRSVPVGVAPFDVALTPDQRSALVASWADVPATSRKTADASGTPVEVDRRGVGVGGVLCRVDLERFEVVAKIPLPRQPSEVAVSADGTRAFVANANDDTVSEIDLRLNRVVRHHEIHPRKGFPFGTAPTSIALSSDGRLYVASGGLNAVAIYSLQRGRVLGWIPAGWYPSCVRLDGDRMLVASAKGFGSRGKPDAQGGRSVYSFTGTISLVTLPKDEDLAELTRRALDSARIAHAMRSFERSRHSVAPKPVPAKLGEPSPIRHVFYIIKENRTYDQVFGDLPRGDGDRNLCMFPREVTPNHHALAEEFVLLDNYYCNGVNSADGHAWSTEGNATAYFEKTFGGWTRSYPFGDDPLATSRTGYIWDNVLDHGLSFRNFGEFFYTEPALKETFIQILRDFEEGRHSVRYRQKVGVERVARYSVWDYPGWNMGIPDVVRARVFLRELRRAEAAGEEWPNLTIIYLPQDHTSGASPGMPTPRAHMADNDLALGRIVEGIAKSRYWPRSAIFVIEDDPQNGVDHIDGHRSICLVISPYAKRGATISEFYNQTSVLHTIERILGLPPMNAMDAMAPLMSACFQSRPNLRPYTALPVTVPLNELNPPASSLRGEARRLALLSARQNWKVPDAVQDRVVNRATWAAVHPGRPYPTEWEGPHGRGLARKGAVLAMGPNEED